MLATARTPVRLLFSLLTVGAVTGAVFALRPVAPVLSLGVLYVFAVLPVAVLWGLAYALPVSLLSMLVFNFLFLPPLHTLALRDSENWVALAVYLVTAVVVSELATLSRGRAAVEAESLRRSDAVKTTILRTLGHDLRSPLTAISAAGEVLEQELPAAERAELVASIRQEAARLGRLVSNLLDLSRLEAGAATPRPELWTVDGLVARALGALGARSARVQVSLPDDSATLRVDPAQIERALVNLLENALESSSPSDPVEVSSERAEGEVVLRVADHGPGLDVRDVDRIFEPFERGTGEAKQGTGLGLAIAKGFVEANGGRLWAEQVQGRGAVLALALAAGKRSGPGGGVSGTANGTRVLVVDDEPQILRALEITLRREGYDVDTARTAGDALAAAAARPPEAVILDLLLPDGRGTEVARELREWSTMPILVLSAVEDEAEKVAALDAGADDYVTKPFSVDELLARLRAALRRSAPTPRAGPGDRRAAARPAEAPRHRCGQERVADADRVRPPPAPGRERGASADPPADPAAGLGPCVQPRVELPARLRLAPAPQDRARPGAAALHPHRARRRLPARRSDDGLIRRWVRLPETNQPSATMRSIAPRARAAISGSTVTSYCRRAASRAPSRA